MLIKQTISEESPSDSVCLANWPNVQRSAQPHMQPAGRPGPASMHITFTHHRKMCLAWRVHAYAACKHQITWETNPKVLYFVSKQVVSLLIFCPCMHVMVDCRVCSWLGRLTWDTNGGQTCISEWNPSSPTGMQCKHAANKRCYAAITCVPSFVGALSPWGLIQISIFTCTVDRVCCRRKRKMDKTGVGRPSNWRLVPVHQLIYHACIKSLRVTCACLI